MATFGRDFVRGATQPAYLEGLFQLGQQIGSAPRIQREEAERRQTQESLVEMINTNNRIAQTGNLKGLEEQRVKLGGMLSDLKDDQSRDLVLGEISRIEDLRQIAQPVAQKRDINTLLRAEQSLSEADSQIANLKQDETPEGQIKLNAAIKAKQAIQSRVDSLRSNAALVTAADNEKIDREIASLTKDEALRSARKNDMIAKLKSVPVDSEAWEALVKEAGEKNLGSAVKSVIADLQEAELKKLEVRKAQEEQRPLSDGEKQELKENKITLRPGISDLEARRIYTRYALANIDKQVAISTRPLDVPSEAKANALVKTTLNFMVRDADLGFSPFTADLSEKVEDLLSDPEELQALQGIVADLSGVEIVDAVKGYIKDKFPERYADYEQALKNRAVEAEEFQDLLDEVYSEDSSLDRDDPTGVDQELARIRAERKLRDAVVRAGSSAIEQGKGRRGGPM